MQIFFHERAKRKGVQIFIKFKTDKLEMLKLKVKFSQKVSYLQNRSSAKFKVSFPQKNSDLLKKVFS